MRFRLPELPFARDALAPHISRETIDYHYGKHHKAYVDKVNELSRESPASLEELVRSATGPLFNNAAQAWNHTFYWHCLSANGDDRALAGPLEGALQKAFGGRDAFLEQFAKAAADNFGSGWTWLVKDGSGALSIVNTSNAETPLRGSSLPLLVADVWEHAYYIDYRNDRKKHLEALKSLLNWRFASERFADANVFQATPLMKEQSAA